MQREAIEHGLADFHRRCSEAGLASTHQRAVIYRVLLESRDHPSPEAVYQRVRERIPTISPATVYKNIRTFVDLGLLREVNSLHQTVRLDANLDRHHHLVCVRCRRVVDFYDERLDGARADEDSLHGFQILRYQVEAHGLCPQCAASGSA